MEPARTTEQRKADVLALLQPHPDRQKDAWVASASEKGEAHLVPMTYYWDGERLVFATSAASRTARNLRRAGRARVALGETRDAVIIEGPVQLVPADNASEDMCRNHTAYAGFDARKEEGYLYILITPSHIQAWREVNELDGREVMIGGEWLT
jgi:general stress protein 26